MNLPSFVSAGIVVGERLDPHLVDGVRRQVGDERVSHGAVVEREYAGRVLGAERSILDAKAVDEERGAVHTPRDVERPGVEHAHRLVHLHQIGGEQRFLDKVARDARRSTRGFLLRLAITATVAKWQRQRADEIGRLAWRTDAELIASAHHERVEGVRLEPLTDSERHRR